jgi:thiol-disulfide isomerase/thioredoxin
MNQIKISVIAILTVILISPACRNNIDGIIITGQVDSINGTKVRLTNLDLTEVYDSTIVRNNQFKFNSTVPEKGFYYIDFHNNIPYREGKFTVEGWLHPCQLYLEKNGKYFFQANGKYQILQNYHSIRSTSPTQQKLDEYYSGVNLKRKRLLAEKRKYLHLADIFLQQGNNDKYKKYLDSSSIIENKERLIYHEGTYEYIKNNPSTLITPYLITKMPDFFENYSLYKNVLDGLDPEVKKTEYTKKAYVLLKATEKLRIGGDVPQIYGSDINGKPFNYDYAKKKYTLIDLWASWCLPCRYQTPQLKAIYQKYKTKDFDILAVSVDKDKEWWIKISKYDNIPWYNVSESVKPKDSKNVENFMATRLPLNYLVNEHGKIIRRDIELDDLDKFLQDSLQEYKN